LISREALNYSRGRASAVALAFCLLVSASAGSVEEERLEIQTLPPEPERPAELEDADVTIIQQEGRIIEEYRLDGQLRAIRVIPVKGRPYYLIDTDGDGILDQRRFALSDDILVPGWVVHSW